jgi:hypothetical protein
MRAVVARGRGVGLRSDKEGGRADDNRRTHVAGGADPRRRQWPNPRSRWRSSVAGRTGAGGGLFDETHDVAGRMAENGIM